MPELTTRLASPERLLRRLLELNASEPQCDLDGLHDLLDRLLTPLLLMHHETDPAAVALHDFTEQFPGVRPPLLTKTAALAAMHHS